MEIGPYEVLGEIGRGGMGAVYHARDPRLDREVAIKLLLKDDDLAAAQRLLREAESLAQLRHPHIVTVHGVEEHEGRQAIVMEWVAGESLQARLDRDEILTSTEASALARPLAEALAYAHAQGVLHRDVKPGNVLLGSDGRVLLTDFGLAKRLDEAEAERLSVSGQLLGSPGYWSPEQARGTRDLLGPHTDVWGLGATLYACVTGLPPLRGRTMAEMVVAATFQPVQPPSELVASIDRELERIVLRCLAKSPQDRYRSAAALAADLARFNAGEELEAASGGGRAVAVLAVLAAGLCGAAAGLIGRGDPTPSPSPTATQVGSAPTEGKTGAAPTALGDGKEWLARAQRRLERGKLHGALDACEKAIAASPKLAGAHALSGQVLARLGRKREGRLACERAVALAPRSASMHYALASVLGISGARRESLDRLRLALKENPKHLPSLVTRGGLLSEDGRLDEARALLERAMKLAPDHHEVRTSMGRLERRARRWKEADAHYTAALKAKPSAELLVERAMVRQGLERLLEALADLNQALKLHDRDPSVWYRRGRVRGLLEDHGGAIADHTRALRLEPELLPARIDRARVQLRRNDLRAAGDDLKAALRIRPRSAAALALRAEVHRREGNRDAAGIDVNAALGLEPNLPIARLVRAKLFYEIRRFTSCEHDCDVILHGAPTYRDALAWRARARSALKSYAGARADAKRFLELAPESDPSRATIKELLRQLDRRGQ